MSSRRSRPPSELPLLWAEYKELTARRLPAGAGGLVRSRRFDRLLLVWALYSCLVLAIVALGLMLGSDLIDTLGWLPSTDAAMAPSGAAATPWTRPS